MNSTWGTEAKLAHLQAAATDPEGIYREGTPPDGFCSELVRSGLFEAIEAPTFFGGVYRITDKGRAFVKANSIPAEW